MKFDIGVVKDHPVAVGGSILVLGGLVFYYIYKGRSSGSSSSSSDIATSTQEFLNAQAAQGVAAAGYNAQIMAAEINAQASNLAVTKQAETYQAAIAAQKDVALGTVTTQGQTALDLATIESELQQSQIDASSKLNQELVPLIAKHYPGSSTGAVQVISALQGQGPEALAYTNPGAYGGGAFSINIPGVGGLSVGTGG